MATVAVYVDHTAVERGKHSLGWLPSPFFKVIDRGHVEGVDAFRHNSTAGYPLGEVAARATFQKRHPIKECVLNLDVQVEGIVDDSLHRFRMVNYTIIGLGGPSQFITKVEAIDQNEMADAPFPSCFLQEDVQLAQIAR